MLRPGARDAMLIDCHAHLTAEAFDDDRAQVGWRAADAGVGAVLVVGEDLADNRRVEAITEQPDAHGPTLLPCFGLHPDRFADDRDPPERAEVDETLDLIRSSRTRLAAIGEVGLDRWWVRDAERRRAQAALLEEIASLARELDLALNVHSRSAGHHAIDLLLECGAPRVLMHAFDGKASHAVRAAEHGYVFSIPPSVLRSEQKQKLVRRLPLQSLALESDSPVLAPERGARNEPHNIRRVAEYIAQHHGVSVDRVAEVTSDNARALFPRLNAVSASA